jgi:hypothetical protein
MRNRVEQGRRRHELTRLAVAALDDFQVQPGLLYFHAVGRHAETLDGGDRPCTNGTYRQQAGADRLTGQVDGTSAALCDTAPEFGARQTQDIAQYPQERHIGEQVNAS